MKGLSSTDPNYPATLSLMGIINPLNPIPRVQENIVDSIPFVTFNIFGSIIVEKI